MKTRNKKNTNRRKAARLHKVHKAKRRTNGDLKKKRNGHLTSS